MMRSRPISKSRDASRNEEREIRSSSIALALPAQAELGDEGPVPVDVVASQVVEQTTTSTDEHEQPTARVMVLLVDLQVLREVVDPSR